MIIETLPERLVREGGMINCGQGLGLMVGGDPADCPVGWVYLPARDATVERVRECLDIAGFGRKGWPEKAGYTGDMP